MEPNETINNELDNYVKTIELLHQKNELYKTIDELKGGRDNLITASGANDDVISKKLDSIETLEELTKKTSTVEGLDWFFTDDTTGEVMQLTYKDGISKEEEVEFRKGLLLYLKQADIHYKEIDKLIENMNKETSEIHAEMNGVISSFTDNVLNYIKTTREKIADQDINGKDKIMKELYYIESAYTFSVFKDIIERYPSIIKNTLNDFTKEVKIIDVANRYKAKLASNKVHSTLIDFVNTDPMKTVEGLLLTKGQYREGYEDLFVFSVIRFFAMEDWKDGYTKKLHSSLMLALRKLKDNELQTETKELMISSMTDYLAVLYTGIK
jgi:hypothetical protein